MKQKILKIKRDYFVQLNTNQTENLDELHYFLGKYKTNPPKAKNRHMGKQNSTESPETKPHIYCQYLAREPRTLNGEERVSSVNGVGKTGYTACKK